MSEVRSAVMDHVTDHPGVHFNQLRRDLDIATGQAQYHLRRLRDAGEVVTERVRDRTHYYPQGYDARERRTIALLRRETARAIVVTALERERPAAADLAEELGLARSTVAWQVAALAEAGVVDKEYDHRGRVRIALRHPDEATRLLGEVSPSLPDKLVDRFTRLVDAGLAD